MTPFCWWQTRCWFSSMRCVFFRQGAGSGRGPPPHRGRPRVLLSLSVAKRLLVLEKLGSDSHSEELEFTSSLLWPWFALFCVVATVDLGLSLLGRFKFTSVCPAMYVLCFFRYLSFGVVHTDHSTQLVLCCKRVRFCILCWSSVTKSATVFLFYFGVWALVRLCRSLCFPLLARSCFVLWFADGCAIFWSTQAYLLMGAFFSGAVSIFCVHARRWLRRHERFLAA